MTQDNSRLDEFDIFIKNYKYPDAELIFKTRLQPLEKIKDDCIVVLDTNVLLAPYDFTSENAIKQFKEQFPERCNPLIAKNKLVIPGQVAREFADNRTDKLKGISYTLSQKKEKLQRIKQSSEINPVIDDLTEFKEVQQLEGELDKLLTEQLDKKLQEYRSAIDKLINQIDQWGWNDPISEIYYSLFAKDVVVDFPIEDKDLFRADLRKRYFHQIPPGYKDKRKLDDGIGDLLIWHTILHIGRMKKENVIFVTGEEKSDWFVRGNKRVLFPRYELVYEYMLHSQGRSFHIVKYPQFLELYGAKPEEVDQLQKEEERQELEAKTISFTDFKSTFNNYTINAGRTNYNFLAESLLAENKIYEWLQSEFPGKQILKGTDADKVDYLIIENEQTVVGVEVKFRFNPSHAFSMIRGIRNDFVHNLYSSKIIKFILFVILEDEAACAKVLSQMTDEFISDKIPYSMLIKLGYLDASGNLIIVWNSR